MATRVMLHAWSLRSRHGSRHGQPSVIADVEEENEKEISATECPFGKLFSLWQREPLK
jgi:hypothetical protein